MIELTKFNDRKFMLNSDLIEYIEENPDTTICLVSGKKYLVKETKVEIRNLIIEYKREIFTHNNI